jgi:hypothetical protein
MIVYDGDGNRVSETVGGVTTNYLVDTVNPTGYAQIVDELQGSTVTRRFSYGLERISETQSSTTNFYGYDGHGSVRQLTNSAGAVTDNVANALHQKIEFSRDYVGYVGSGGYACSYKNVMRIWLGPLFFKAPMVGIDSKAGTIIHELTHIVDGTEDFHTYGVVPSMALSPDLAVRHADSYEYYAEESFLAH